MMTFNDFVDNYKLKSKAASTLKIQQLLSSIGLDNVDIMLVYIQETDHFQVMWQL